MPVTASRGSSSSLRGLAAVCALCVSAACATTTPRTMLPQPPPETLASTSLQRAVDWDQVGDEAFEALRGYLQVPTVNPPGDEELGAKYLADILAREGIDAEILPLEGHPGRANLIARLKSDRPSAGPLCLVSHIDVVTTEAAQWPADAQPFSGAVKTVDGEPMLYGRGALDMKGMGIFELYSMILLKRLGLPLSRDVVLLAVADEEVGSLGMEAAIGPQWDKLGCTHAINEGGLGLKDALFDGQTTFAISVAERGVFWMRVVANGPPGHGSTPIPGRAPQKLLEAMRRIDTYHMEPRIHPSLYEMLAAAGAEEGGLEGFITARPFLIDLLVAPSLLSRPQTQAIVTDTINLTGFGGANEPNVVPSEVFAQYDVRLLPGTSPANMQQRIQALLDEGGKLDGVRIEVLSVEPATASPWDDPVYDALARHVAHGVERAAVGPVVSPGFTDSVLLRKKGVRAYGLVPIVVTPAEASTMHGNGERISKANVKRGVKVLALAIADVSVRVP